LRRRNERARESRQGAITSPIVIATSIWRVR
jgi:hypothetical protein